MQTANSLEIQLKPNFSIREEHEEQRDISNVLCNVGSNHEMILCKPKRNEKMTENDAKITVFCAFMDKFK